MTATLNPITAAPVRRPRVLPVAITGAVAGVGTAAVLYAYGAVAQAAGVPMAAGEVGAAHAVPLSPANFSVGVLTCTVIGTVLAMALARWAARPARAFLVAGVLLVLVSLLFPGLAAHTAASTKVVLAGGHLLAAALIIPALFHRLSRPAPRSAARGVRNAPGR
jgi:Family of unknown function (DUF6069)